MQASKRQHNELKTDLFLLVIMHEKLDVNEMKGIYVIDGIKIYIYSEN